MQAIRHDRQMIEAARQAMATAETPMQLRQSLAILIPALTGVGLQATAEILGLSRSGVSKLRRQFLAGGGVAGEAGAKRGGRRCALMSTEREREFMRPWVESARKGLPLDVSQLRAAYERAVGRIVAKSTIYRLLGRHGWRRDILRG